MTPVKALSICPFSYWDLSPIVVAVVQSLNVSNSLRPNPMDCGRPGFPVQLLGADVGNEDEWQRLSIMHCDHLHFGEIGLGECFQWSHNIQSSLALDGNGLSPFWQHWEECSFFHFAARRAADRWTDLLLQATHLHCFTHQVHIKADAVSTT